MVFKGLGSLYARQWTILLSRYQKEERFGAAVKSGEKAGTSNKESMPAPQSPCPSSITLEECAYRVVDKRRPEKENTIKL